MQKIKYIEIERGIKLDVIKVYYLIDLDGKYIYLENELLHEENCEFICGYMITYKSDSTEISMTARETNITDRNFILDELLWRKILATSENGYFRGYVRGSRY